MLLLNLFIVLRHIQEEGTLIGTALAICFGYWLGVSSLLFFIAYVVNAHLSMVQVFSLTVRILSRSIYVANSLVWYVDRDIPSVDTALCCYLA